MTSLIIKSGFVHLDMKGIQALSRTCFKNFFNHVHAEILVNRNYSEREDIVTVIIMASVDRPTATHVSVTLPTATPEVAMSSTKLSLPRPGAARVSGFVPSMGCNKIKHFIPQNYCCMTWI